MSNCQDLQNIGINLTTTYQLTNDIDCNNFTFSSIGSPNTPFRGIIDGKGQAVLNLVISSSPVAAIFQCGQSATVQNLCFQNVNISGSTRVGILFGYCSHCNIQNITVSSDNSNNILGGANSTVGTIVGELNCSSITSIVVKNTFVSCPFYNFTTNFFGTGGLVGVSFNSSLTECYNLGFQNQNLEIVNATVHVGGIVGFCINCVLSKCGTEKGRIYGFSEAGGIAGQLYITFTAQQLYVTENVSISCNSICGGLTGFLQTIANFATLTINNSYSSSSVSGNCFASLFGKISTTSTNALLQLDNIYSNSILINNTQANFIGYLTACVQVPNSTQTSTNLFFLNNTANRFPFIGSYHSGNSTGFSPLLLNNPLFYQMINSSFDPSVWIGCHLKSEYSFNMYGNLRVTQLPTTFNPTTTFPTTQLPTTQFSTTQFSTTTFPSAEFLATSYPSTLNPIITTPATNVPTFLCSYQVANCHLCPFDAPLFDLTQGNISCGLFQNEWGWRFTPNNGTLKNNGEIVVSGNMTILIEGNLNNNANLNISTQSTFVIEGVFIQSSEGKTTFTFNPSYSNSSKTSFPLKVVGNCVTLKFPYLLKLYSLFR